MANSFQNIRDDSGGGGGGAVDSVNGQTGIVVLSKGDVGLSDVDNVSSAFLLDRTNHTGTQDSLTITGNANSIAYFDSLGQLDEIPGLSIDTTSGGINQGRTYQPNDVGGFNINYTYAGLDPLQDSPTDTYNLHSSQIQFDSNSSGFDQGTNGEAANIYTPYFSHQGTGDIGSFNFTKMSFEIGNGTDPINVKGMAYNLGFGSFRDGVTLTGPVQGYVFQPSATSAVTVTTNAYVNAFSDGANFQTAVAGWTSLNMSPQIAEIQNNTNYNGASFNPTITSFDGNAGAFVLGIYGNYGTFDTGGWTGIQINPNVTSVVNATGIYVNMDNVTASGTKRAIDVVGDVAIQGSLSFTGSLAMGQLTAFYSSNPVDGGGNPQNMHGLTTEMIALNGVTTANCDVIGVNTSMLIRMEANSISTSGAFGLGFSALALPCVVETHTGSSLDYMSGAVFAANLVGSSTGGTIQNINLCRSLVIPNGITTVDNARGFYYHEPFGPAGTNSWGFYNEADVGNFFKGSLKIDGTAGSTDKVTNSSVGLEIESTTKAFLPSRMTSTERDALTAINGMVLYNTTTDKLQVRAAGAWVDLH